MKSNKTKRLVIKIYLLLAVIIIFAAMLLCIISYAQNQLPECLEIKMEGDQAGFLTFSEFNDLHISKASAYTETVFRNEIRSEKEIKFILCDENFADNYNIQIIAGQFFNRGIVDDKIQYAVISEDLALELYMSYNIIGQKIVIKNSEYEIIGVYETENSTFSKLAQDIYERVYIPYTTISGYKEIEVTSIIIPNDDKTFANIDKIFLKYPYLKYFSNQINYSEKQSYISQFPGYIIFVFQIYIVIILFIIAYKSFIELSAILNAQKHRLYLNDLINQNKKRIIISIGIFAVCGTGIFFIIKNIALKIVMSIWFMPEDNIFSLAHYKAKIIEFFQYNNTYLTEGNNYYAHLADISLFSSIAILVVLIPAIIIFIKHYKELSKRNFVLSIEIIFYLVLIMIISIIKYNSDVLYSNAVNILLYFIIALGISIINKNQTEFFKQFESLSYRKT